MKSSHVFAVCAYGESPYLEECIRSLKAQSVKTDVICCTSTPCPYINRIAGKYSVPVYARAGESGIREDWMFAWRTAGSNHSLVTIAHQDDRYHRDYVKTLLSRWKQYPDMTVFCSDYVVMRTKERAVWSGQTIYPESTRLAAFDTARAVKKLLRTPLRFRALAGRPRVKKSALIFGNSICCPTCTYSHDIIGDHMFRSGYSFVLDWDNLYELAGRAGRFICEERPLLAYRVHDSATTKQCIMDRRRSEEEYAMFRRIWPGWAVRALMYFYRKAYAAYGDLTV